MEDCSQLGKEGLRMNGRDWKLKETDWKKMSIKELNQTRQQMTLFSVGKLLAWFGALSLMVVA